MLPDENKLQTIFFYSHRPVHTDTSVPLPGDAATTPHRPEFDNPEFDDQLSRLCQFGSFPTQCTHKISIHTPFGRNRDNPNSLFEVSMIEVREQNIPGRSLQIDDPKIHSFFLGYLSNQSHVRVRESLVGCPPGGKRFNIQIDNGAWSLLRKMATE